MVNLPRVTWLGFGTSTNFLIAAATGIDTNQNVSIIVSRGADGPDAATNAKMCSYQYKTYPNGSRINNTRTVSSCPYAPTMRPWYSDAIPLPAGVPAFTSPYLFAGQVTASGAPIMGITGVQHMPPDKRWGGGDAIVLADYAFYTINEVLLPEVRE